MQCNLMFRYVSHASYEDYVPLMGLIAFCVLHIVAQSYFPELFAMHRMTLTNAQSWSDEKAENNKKI